MPKDTFNNLNEEKKEKIFGAAVKEFSTKRFSEASINKIVKVAGIPRGSFYQYFSGKEDIYRYMAEEIAREQAVVMRFITPPAADSSAFDELIYKARAVIELFRVRPEYRKIAMLMEKDDSGLINARFVSAEEVNRIKDLLERDKQRSRIKQSADSGLVAEMAYSLIKKEYLKAGQNVETIMKRINEILKIIKEGIAA